MGLLSEAISARIVELVNINQVKYLPFGSDVGSHLKTVGVRGLSACSVVILVSKYGAIVAHVGTNILGSTDHRSFIHLAQQKMDELQELYQSNIRRFMQGTKTFVVFATFGGVPTSKEQTDVFRQRLRALNLAIDRDVSYERPHLQNVSDYSPQGTLWVDGRRDPPLVYLEDRDITPRDLTTLATTPSGGGVPAQSYWVLLHGGTEYVLLRTDGTVLQRSSVPPTGQWIRRYDRANRMVAVMQWDGVRWILSSE